MNDNLNPHHVPMTAGAETAKKLSFNKKQLAMFLIPIACLIAIGIFGVMGGFISTSQSTSADSTHLDLAPPEAKLKNVKGDEKYDKDFTPSDLSPNRSGTNALDQHAAQNTEMLTGQNPTQRLGTNEYLTENDLREIEQRNNKLKFASPTEQKQFQKRQFTQQNQRQLREQQRVLNTMYRSPKSREQLTEERQDQSERDFNRRATEAVLRQIEMANKRNMGGQTEGGTSPILSAEPLMSKEYLTLKKAYGGQLPAEYRTLFKKEIEAENKGLFKNEAVEPSTLILTESEKKSSNGFYGANSTKTNFKSTRTNNTAIEAVIHGDGDKVIVENGSTLKIRLTETVQLLLNSERVTLPAHTLLAGTCQINGERISIIVSSIRLGAALYQTNLTVYDLDGRAGLYVPKIREKNIMANCLGQSAQTAVASPSFFIQQGSLGQQVGTQMALQAGNSLFSGVRAYAQAKIANVKVTVNRSGDPPQLQNLTQTHRTGEFVRNNQRIINYLNMKLFFYPTALVALILSFSGYAQKEGVSVANPILTQSINSTPYILPIDKGSVKGSYPIGVSNRKTTYIISPAKIREFDAGTGDVIAQIPETVPNILRVKAKEKADFCETNMTVITEEGGFYSFLIRFQEDPEILNINIANNLLADNFTSDQKGMNHSPIISLSSEKNENEMLTECQKVQKLTSFVRNIGASKMKITCLLTSLYVKNKTIYFQMSIKNDSEIDYEIDFFKFYLRDKDVLKRMAAQEVEIKPFANYPKTLTTIRSNTEYTTVYALPLRTFPEDKVIEVELYEKDGGRHLRFQVESDIMLQAKNL